MLWTPNHFRIEELVPPGLFDEYRDNQWKLWLMFDDRILLAAAILREQFGPAVINDWLWGGAFVASGLRVPGAQHYSQTSQHAWGRALDLKFSDVDAATVREHIIESNGLSGLISAIEADVTWNHIDCRMPKRSGQIMVFTP